MIRTFAQEWLEEFFHSGKPKRIKPQLRGQVFRKLDMLNQARELRDLQSPPGNHLHALTDDRKGQYTISVNGPWRLCFRFEEGDVFDIELTQYH